MLRSFGYNVIIIAINSVQVFFGRHWCFVFMISFHIPQQSFLHFTDGESEAQKD